MELGGNEMALLHVQFYSHMLDLSLNMNVVLPQCAPNEPVKKYKTLYLLHGMHDDYSGWLRKTSIERYATEKGIAVVMPEVHLSFYADTKYGMKYWQFISKELPKICHEFFPNMSQRREDNFVAGLSMGGYGAMKLGLLSSDQFSHAASFSGALDLASRGMISGEGYFMTLFGTIEEFLGSENDLFAQAEKLVESGKELPKLYIWCGTEDFLYSHSVKFNKHCKELGFDVTYEESEGSHEWQYWDERVKRVLDWLPLDK